MNTILENPITPNSFSESERIHLTNKMGVCHIGRSEVYQCEVSGWTDENCLFVVKFFKRDSRTTKLERLRIPECNFLGNVLYLNESQTVDLEKCGGGNERSLKKLLRNGKCAVSLMKYYGETLETFMKSRKKYGAISNDDILEILYQLLSGAHHMWIHGIVHRDIRPANITITKKKEVRIIDFDCHLECKEGFYMSEAQNMYTKGSEKYCPPEITRGTGEYTSGDHSKYDIFSVGKVLEDLLDCVPSNVSHSHEEEYFQKQLTYLQKWMTEKNTELRLSCNEALFWATKLVEYREIDCQRDWRRYKQCTKNVGGGCRHHSCRNFHRIENLYWRFGSMDQCPDIIGAMKKKERDIIRATELQRILEQTKAYLKNVFSKSWLKISRSRKMKKIGRHVKKHRKMYTTAAVVGGLVVGGVVVGVPVVVGATVLAKSE